MPSFAEGTEIGSVVGSIGCDRASMAIMRHVFSIVLAGSLVASVAPAQEPSPAASTKTAPAPAAVVATGSAQNSASGSTSDPSARESDVPAKPARRAERKAKKRKYVKGPIVNFPAFRIQPDGSSRVYVVISEKVIVSERKAEGRLAYRIKGASVPVKTNLLPLETGFFKTPVARVMLVEAGDEDVELVVELRQPSASTYNLVDTDRGMILQVDFPPLAPQNPAPPPAK
jgi:hypothetical protein